MKFYALLCVLIALSLLLIPAVSLLGAQNKTSAASAAAAQRQTETTDVQITTMKTQER